MGNEKVIALRRASVRAFTLARHRVLPRPGHRGRPFGRRFCTERRQVSLRVRRFKTAKDLAGYPKLRVGMSKSEVQTLLGEPDYGKLTHRGLFADPDGSLWEYHLYKSEKLWTNEVLDRLVYAFFDEAGKIYWIEPLNIDGLARIGQPVRE